MNIPIVAPFSKALRRTRAMLFDSYNLSKWIGLGFCAWLAQLGSGGFSFSQFYNVDLGGGSGGVPPVLTDIKDWFFSHKALALSLLAGVTLLSCLSGALLTWLNSRGQFMFLDGVVKDRGEIAASWREYKIEANSLFLFRLCFTASMLAAYLLLGGGCVLLAWGDIHARVFESGALSAAVLFVFLGIVIFLLGAVVDFFLYDFVLPAMYLRRIRVRQAWRVMWAEIFPHQKALLLYSLFVMLLDLGMGLAAMLLMCVTCFITALPLVGTVILLPLTVLMLNYKLYFLQGFGPQWRFLPEADAELYDEVPVATGSLGDENRPAL